LNLRQKFIWNTVIAISTLVLLWNAWNQLYKHSDIKRAYIKYTNEEIGTDKELQNMVTELEKNLNSRQTMKFRLKENPLDLTRVISIDGNFSSRGVKGIDCKGAWSNGNGSFTAVCNYRAKRYEITVGDSIGGGIVSDISATKIFIEKEDQTIMFNFGLDKYDEN